MRTFALRTVSALLAVAALAASTTSASTASAQSAPATGTSDSQAAAPVAVPASEDVVIPIRETRPGPNAPMLVTGTVLLGGTYAASAIGAWQSERSDDQKLYYPVVGPWLNLANRDCTGRTCDNEDLNKALLIADGVGQGVGALLMVSSLFVPNGKRFLMFSAKNEPSRPHFTVTPSRLGFAAYGMAAVGTF